MIRAKMTAHRSTVAQALASGALCVGLIACASLSGASPVPTASPTPPASSAPTASPAVNSSDCPILGAGDLADAIATPVTFASAESQASVCVFDVQAGSPYRLVVRVEDSFPDIGAVASVFPDARDVAVGNVHGLWASAVTTLWVPGAADGLYAIQFLNFSGSDSEAEQVAAEAGGRLLSAP